MRCEEALEAISAAVDGELADDDGTVRRALDEHLAGCEECRDFQSFTVELRAHLRFEAVDITPDVAPAVVALLERTAAEAASAEAGSGAGEGGGSSSGSGRGEGATVTPLPFWRRARSVLRPSGRAGTGPSSVRDVERRGRPLAAAVAAAVVTGMIVGAAFVGFGHDTTPTAWAEDLPEQVIEAQRDITSLDADIVVVEQGRPDHDGERRFNGHLSYEAPERLALELTEDVRPGQGGASESSGAPAVSDDGWVAGGPSAGRLQLQPGEGDVRLLVREDSWWLETVRRCTVISGETSCTPGGDRWIEEVVGREPFSDAAPIPLELIGAVDSFTLAAAPPVLGERRIAGRDAVGVRVPAAQVAHFLAALSPGGDLRAVHPGDPVDVWLDRDDLVPLAVDVAAGESDERAAWATANDFREEPGDTILSFSVVSIDVNEAVPNAVFEWPEVEDDDASSASGGGEGAGDDAAADPSSADAGGTGDTGLGGTDAAGGSGFGTGDIPGEEGFPPDSGVVDGGGAGPDLGPGDGTGEGEGGAGLPTSTTMTLPAVPSPVRGDQPGEAAPARPARSAESTSTTVPVPSTTLPGEPGDPGTTTTTPSTTTSLPPLTTTTTTGPVDGDSGGLVDEPVEDPGLDAGAEGPAADDAGAAGSDSAGFANSTTRDEGFRPGSAALVPEPSRLPDGMEPYVSGAIQTGDGPVIGTRSWTDGRAWVKVRATDGWDGPRLFGELGEAVRQVELAGAGQGFVSADGRKVAVHTGGLDAVVSGSVPTEQLRDIAASLDLDGEPVPLDWPEAASATLEEVQAMVPGLLIPRALEGFGPPAVDLEGGTVTQIYAGPGDRTFALIRSDTPVLAPPTGDDSFGVEVRAVDGRYSVERGELEWAEGGASYSLRSSTVTLRELLTIADTLAPVPDTP